MKAVKTFCFAAIGSGLLLVIAFAGSASATVLCATTTTSCNNRWGLGIEIDASMEPGKTAEFKDTNGNLLDKCGESTLKMTTTKVGSATETVKAGFAKGVLTWNSCTVATTTIAGGEAEIHHLTGTDNGTITANSMQVTLNTVLFGTCVYGLGAFTNIGTFTGGSVPKLPPPVLDINAVLSKLTGSGATCPTTTRWIAIMEVTSPDEPKETGIYVEPS